MGSFSEWSNTLETTKIVSGSKDSNTFLYVIRVNQLPGIDEYTERMALVIMIIRIIKASIDKISASDFSCGKRTNAIKFIMTNKDIIIEKIFLGDEKNSSVFRLSSKSLASCEINFSVSIGLFLTKNFF